MWLTSLTQTALGYLAGNSNETPHHTTANSDNSSSQEAPASSPSLNSAAIDLLSETIQAGEQVRNAVMSLFEETPAPPPPPAQRSGRPLVGLLDANSAAGDRAGTVQTLLNWSNIAGIQDGTMPADPNALTNATEDTAIILSTWIEQREQEHDPDRMVRALSNPSSTPNQAGLWDRFVTAWESDAPLSDRVSNFFNANQEETTQTLLMPQSSEPLLSESEYNGHIREASEHLERLLAHQYPHTDLSEIHRALERIRHSRPGLVGNHAFLAQLAPDQIEQTLINLTVERSFNSQLTQQVEALFWDHYLSEPFLREQNPQVRLSLGTYSLHQLIHWSREENHLTWRRDLSPQDQTLVLQTLKHIGIQQKALSDIREKLAHSSEDSPIHTLNLAHEAAIEGHYDQARVYAACALREIRIARSNAQILGASQDGLTTQELLQFELSAWQLNGGLMGQEVLAHLDQLTNALSQQREHYGTTEGTQLYQEDTAMLPHAVINRHHQRHLTQLTAALRQEILNGRAITLDEALSNLRAQGESFGGLLTADTINDEQIRAFLHYHSEAQTAARAQSVEETQRQQIELARQLGQAGGSYAAATELLQEVMSSRLQAMRTQLGPEDWQEITRRMNEGGFGETSGRERVVEELRSLGGTETQRNRVLNLAFSAEQERIISLYLYERLGDQGSHLGERADYAQQAALLQREIHDLSGEHFSAEELQNLIHPTAEQMAGYVALSLSIALSGGLARVAMASTAATLGLDLAAIEAGTATVSAGQRALLSGTQLTVSATSFPAFHLGMTQPNLLSEDPEAYAIHYADEAALLGALSLISAGSASLSEALKISDGAILARTAQQGLTLSNASQAALGATLNGSLQLGLEIEGLVHYNDLSDALARSLSDRALHPSQGSAAYERIHAAMTIGAIRAGTGAAKLSGRAGRAVWDTLSDPQMRRMILLGPAILTGVFGATGSGGGNTGRNHPLATRASAARYLVQLRSQITGETDPAIIERQANEMEQRELSRSNWQQTAASMAKEFLIRLNAIRIRQLRSIELGLLGRSFEPMQEMTFENEATNAITNAGEHWHQRAQELINQRMRSIKQLMARELASLSISIAAARHEAHPAESALTSSYLEQLEGAQDPINLGLRAIENLRRQYAELAASQPQAPQEPIEEVEEEEPALLLTRKKPKRQPNPELEQMRLIAETLAAEHLKICTQAGHPERALEADTIFQTLWEEKFRYHRDWRNTVATFHYQIYGEGSEPNRPHLEIIAPSDEAYVQESGSENLPSAPASRPGNHSDTIRPPAPNARPTVVLAELPTRQVNLEDLNSRQVTREAEAIDNDFSGDFDSAEPVEDPTISINRWVDNPSPRRPTRERGTQVIDSSELAAHLNRSRRRETVPENPQAEVSTQVAQTVRLPHRFIDGQMTIGKRRAEGANSADHLAIIPRNIVGLSDYVRIVEAGQGSGRHYRVQRCDGIGANAVGIRHPSSDEIYAIASNGETLQNNDILLFRFRESGRQVQIAVAVLISPNGEISFHTPLIRR